MAATFTSEFYAPVATLRLYINSERLQFSDKSKRVEIGGFISVDNDDDDVYVIRGFFRSAPAAEVGTQKTNLFIIDDRGYHDVPVDVDHLNQCTTISRDYKCVDSKLLALLENSH